MSSKTGVVINCNQYITINPLPLIGSNSLYYNKLKNHFPKETSHKR